MPCAGGQPPLPGCEQHCKVIQVPHAFRERREGFEERRLPDQLDHRRRLSRPEPVRLAQEHPASPALPAVPRRKANGQREPSANRSRGQPGLTDERALDPEGRQTAGRSHVLAGRTLSTAGPNTPEVDAVETNPTGPRCTSSRLSRRLLELRRSTYRGHLSAITRMVATLPTERLHCPAAGQRGARTLTRDPLSPLVHGEAGPRGRDVGVQFGTNGDA